MIIMDIRKDGSEKIKYDYDGYYAYIRKGFLSHYPNYSADSHWHDDLEFIYVLDGSMKYNVNGETVLIEAGNGIMVNTCQLHFGFSETKQECEFICVLLHPMLLCSSQTVERDYISDILSDDTTPYILLQKENGWQSEILKEIETIFSCKDCNTAPLCIQSSFYRIWSLLYENTKRHEKTSRKGDRQLSVLKNMISFIHKNYGDKILLDDIATAGNVSKSSCLLIFKKYLNDTPINYLISYRLKKASLLLKDSDIAISDISLCVGFPSISYFTELFHKSFGKTPSQYRNE